MNYISEITYGTTSGGGMNGLVMFEIVFNGQEPNLVSSEEIATMVSKIRRHPGATCKRIHICGTYPEIKTDVVLTILGAFRSVGFETYATVNGLYIYQWMTPTMLNGIRVHLKQPEWVVFPFNELILDIADVNSPDPEMPQTYNDMIPIYLNPLKSLTKSDLFHYIQSSKYRWNINTTTRSIKEYLFKEGE